MSSTGPANKGRGYRAEVKAMKYATAAGWSARRAWGSDGRALGMEPGVDLALLEPGSDSTWVGCQVKGMAKVPASVNTWRKYLYAGCELVVLMERRQPGERYAPEPLALVLLETHLGRRWNRE